VWRARRTSRKSPPPSPIADATLQTIVAVRDRVIAAYQDIIKMTI